MEDRTTRVVETVWLFWAFHFVGFVNGILGPTLLDLKELFHSSMEEMSYIFFVRGAGFVVGVVLAYIFEQCMSTRLILTCSLLIGCTVQIALPYGTNYYCLAVAFFIMGVTAGIINNVTISICNKLWPEKKGVPFQFVVVGSGIGSFLAPFLATPFLANTDSSDDEIWMTNDTIADHLQSHANGTQSHLPLDQSRVQYAYMIAGLICVPPVFAFTHFYWKRKHNPLINYENIQQTVKQLYSLRTILFIALLCFYHIAVRGVVLAYGDLLTPYGVDLHLSKFRMAVMTSIFWGCFLLGKILNLLLSDYFSNFVLICINISSLFIGCVTLSAAGNSHEVVLWMGTAVVGVSSSSYFPMVLAWSAEYVHLTAGVITLTIMANSMGCIIIPFAAGQLFTRYAPHILMYFITVIVTFKVLLFLFLVICSKGMGTHYQ